MWYTIIYSSIIPTGPLCGHRKRPVTDRARALDLSQVTSLANAFAFAEKGPLRLDAGLVVTWRHTELYDDDNWPRLQTELLDHATRFLRGRGITTAFLWVRERATGHGAHTHFLLHLGHNPLPSCRALCGELRRRFHFGPEGIHISMGEYGMLNVRMRAGQFRYLLKGFDHQAFRYTGIGSETENIADVLAIENRGPQGIINMKRCGTSQNISYARAPPSGLA